MDVRWDLCKYQETAKLYYSLVRQNKMSHQFYTHDLEILSQIKLGKQK